MQAWGNGSCRLGEIAKYMWDMSSRHGNWDNEGLIETGSCYIFMPCCYFVLIQSYLEMRTHFITKKAL